MFSVDFARLLCLICFILVEAGDAKKKIKLKSLIVKTKNGAVQGTSTTTVELGKTYYAYRGIPFAQPPVGEMRFEPPVPVANWNGTWDATKDGPICVQSINPVIGQEDCLYLNVYTPKPPSKKNKLPVMVWIYGGAFELGSCTYDDYGPDYFLDRDVIVATINYRIGFLGFFSTSDLVVPGNNGLKDQVVALKWIRANIAAFGGDPNKITIFGGSAGSVSTSYLLQSPTAQGLFQQAIMQSGTSFCLWSLSRIGTQVGFEVGAKLGVNTTDSRTLVDHLKTIDVVELHTTAKNLANEKLVSTNPRNGFIFAPVIEPYHEQAYMTEKSHKWMSEGKFQPVPVIIGYNSMEASIAIGLAIRAYLIRFDANPELLVPIDMNIKNATLQVEVGKQIKKQYFGLLPISLANLQVMKYISEDQFVRPITEFVRQLAKKTTVYMYKFSYIGGLSGIMDRVSDGASHSEEISYMWRSKNNATSEYDLIVRDRMVSMWTDFAKFGNPTPTTSLLLDNKLWLPSNAVGQNNFVYLNIDKNLTLNVNEQYENMKFWDNLYQEYAIPYQDTY